MTTTYAIIQIQDAVSKISLYLNSLLSNSHNAERCQKAVYLATETYLKFMENEDFAKECYEKVRLFIHSKNNYYAFLIFDQMIKNNKFAYKSGKQQCQNLFKGVWERTWSESNDSPKLQHLKLIVKVWGYIYGPKYQDSIRKWVEYTFKTKFTIQPEREAELKQIYGVPEVPKIDSKMDELLQNMKDEKEQNLLQAFIYDQD